MDDTGDLGRDGPSVRGLTRAHIAAHDDDLAAGGIRYRRAARGGLVDD